MAKEREYQTILQQVLKEREQEITLLRMRSESEGLSLNSLTLTTAPPVQFYIFN